MVDFLRSRFPPRRDIFLSFSVVTIAIHFWAIILFLFEFPALIRRTGVADQLGVIAYIQLIALFESLLLLGFLLLLSAILPGIWMRYHFGPVSSILGILIIVWAISLQSQGFLLNDLHLEFLVLEIPVVFFLFYRYPGLRKRVEKVFKRFDVLAMIYLSLDLIGFIYLSIRLLWKL